jgi:CBS domain-containing protein
MSETKPVETLLKEKRIYQIVNPRLVQASPDISVKAAIELMQQNKSGYVVIAKAKKVVGIFTEADVVQKVLDKDQDGAKPVSEFMQKDPLVLNIKDTVGAAIDIMGDHRIYHVPLVDDRKELVNVISVRTLIRFLAEFYPTEIYNLPPRPDQVMPTEEGG